MIAQGTPRRLRFAVMCNTLVLQQWQHDAIESLLSRGEAEPVLLILKQEDLSPKPGLLRRIVRYPWRKLLFRKYYQYFFRPGSFRAVSADEQLGGLPRIRCKTALKGKYSEYFSPEDIDTIRSHRPDFILKFGFGIIRGEILESASYGIWSFHHGDEQKYRGIPPAFYEILHHDNKTGTILQRLTGTLDGGIILRKGYFPTINHSWSANLDQAIRLSVHWPADVCHEIVTQHTFPADTQAQMPAAPVFHEPENATLLIFLFRMFYNKLRFHFLEVFTAENWRIGIVRTRAADLLSEVTFSLDGKAVDWLSAGGPDQYYADGFIVKEQSRQLLVFEDYSYRRRKATLSGVWYNERDYSFSAPFTLLNEDWHLSYPFLFRDGNQLWCIPESLQQNSIMLYRYDEATNRFLYHSTLIEGVAAADPTLVLHQHHYYLFFTSGRATNTELQIWHSASLSGPFEPHELNPVKANISNARPAGPFFSVDGKLFRPAQDCSRTYGGRVIINEVKLLTESEFLELPVTSLNPPGGYDGLHTISFSGDYLCFDAKKLVFSPASALWQIRRRLGMVKPHKPTRE